MISTFIFDLGNVLIHFNESKMLQALAELFQEDPEDFRKHSYSTSLQNAYEKGEINSKELLQYLCLRSNTDVSMQSFKDAFNRSFWPNQDMCKVIRHMGKKGHRLLLLSNTSSLHFEYIQEKYPVLDWFEKYILSYREHSIKPENAIYLEALKQAKCAPSHCLFIDDKKENILAAQKLGMQGIFYKNYQDFCKKLHALNISIEEILS